MKTEESLQEQIQQLADGALAFGERTKLLRAIDADQPENWREVALAFVERDILAEAAVAKPQARSVATMGAWLAAACVALGCFLLGLLSRPGNTEQAPVAAAAKPVVVQPALDYPVPSPELVRAANARLASTGYEASLLTRYVRTQLDGREVVIPLSQVRLDYRGL